MVGSREIFEEIREAEMAEESTIWNEACPLPIINLNQTSPNEENIELQFGNEKPEKFNRTSNDIAQQIIIAITEGKINPVEFAVKKKLVVDAFDIAMKDKSVKEMMISEVEKHGKAGCTSMGAKVTIFSRSTYDYSKDPTWNRLKESIKETEEAMKAQEDRIKIACKNNVSLVNEEGEIVASIVPAPASQSIAVSFSKKK